MHENLLASAVVPDRTTVLGRRLMPYSIGCEMQLHKLNSPFLLLSSRDFEQLPLAKRCLALLQAVSVCAEAAPRHPRRWEWWLRGCPVRLWPFKKVILLGNGVDFELETSVFRTYLAAGRLEFPAELPTGEDLPVRYIGAPEALRLYKFLCKHIPREEIAIYGQSAWDFPLGLARMIYQTHAESEGNLEIYNIKTKIAEDYHAQCENGRAAWENAQTDDEKRQALEEHPIIRELPYLAEDFAAWEAKQPLPDEKGTPCPES